ncbi:unnamed protein product [Moneuplotes crassus]|uniref:Uncharacterized protein n=1 Tax=Euplotes crassus TaxID=5936 RepID=A0AAD1XJK6_EUPCR|nr:unnamed protein product [Moneuplotes crassus]
MQTTSVLITLGLVSLAIVGLYQSSDDQLEAQFTSFLIQFDKSYQTEEEYNYRRSIFNKNLETINAHNAKGLSWTLGTDEEYKAILGYRRSHNLQSSNLRTIKSKGVKDLQSIDHVSNGYVNPIKDQGACGSCWAFAAVASVEGAYAKEHGELKRFSEAHLNTCDKFSGGCHGGWAINGILFFTQRGPILEKDYPYTYFKSECREEEFEIDHPTVPYAYRVEDDEDSLYEALTHNVVAVAIRAENPEFRSYRGGVIDGEACGTEMDHAVTLVGYEKETDSWIVKNSWGEHWGENGFVRIKRRSGKGVCGINQDTAQAVFRPEDY